MRLLNLLPAIRNAINKKLLFKKIIDVKKLWPLSSNYHKFTLNTTKRRSRNGFVTIT